MKLWLRKLVCRVFWHKWRVIPEDLSFWIKNGGDISVSIICDICGEHYPEIVKIEFLPKIEGGIFKVPLLTRICAMKNEVKDGTA